MKHTINLFVTACALLALASTAQCHNFACHRNRQRLGQYRRRGFHPDRHKGSHFDVGRHQLSPTTPEPRLHLQDPHGEPAAALHHLEGTTTNFSGSGGPSVARPSNHRGYAVLHMHPLLPWYGQCRKHRHHHR